MGYYLKDEYVQAYFATLGLDVHDAQMFFKVLTRASGRAEVSIEEFVDRAVKMKGEATSLDLQGVACEVRRIREDVFYIGQACGIVDLTNVGVLDAANVAPRKSHRS